MCNKAEGVAQMAIDERERPVLAILDEMGIEYTRYEHISAKTMQACEGIGAPVGAQHFKNLFLCNRARTAYCLLLMRADKPFHTSDISKKLGVSRLSFCTDEQLYERLNLLPGSVTPMALYHPTARDIIVAIDRDVANMEMVCVHPCVSTASLAIKFSDLVSYIERMGNEIKYVDIEV